MKFKNILGDEPALFREHYSVQKTALKSRDLYVTDGDDNEPTVSRRLRVYRHLPETLLAGINNANKYLKKKKKNDNNKSDQGH